MIPKNSLVFAIDDDPSVRKGLTRLLRSAGYKSEIFESASDFLEREQHAGPACVIVDVRMPGINGMDLQETLIQRRREEQLIFITGHGDISMCAQAMKAGAVDFLPKPFRDDDLLGCVERALIRSAEQRRHSAEENEARTLLGLLTPRELRSDAACRHRHVEQTDCRRTWHGGKDSKSSSRPRDAEAECYFRCGASEVDGKRVPRTCG